MLRGLYTAASGMNAEVLEQDVVANNIANSTTVGFKKDQPVFEAFPNRLLQRIHDRMDRPQGTVPAIVAQNMPMVPLGYLGQGVKSDGTVTQFTAGPLTRTDGKLDLALEGDGLFTVQKADGSTAYTRAGNFTVNSAKQLTTLGGDLVMARNGQPIVLDGKDVVVDTQGGVQVDGNTAGTLALVSYDPARFSKVGENLWTRSEPDIEPLVQSNPPDVTVRQGFQEQSNVQVVSEMVRMITLMRAYEANTKTITMQDETVSKLLTNVGTPSA